MKIAIISCGVMKLKGIHPAKYLYNSGYFKIIKLYAESFYKKYFILFGLYGLISPEDRIATYNKFIVDLTEEEKLLLKSKVKDQWNDLISSDDEIDFLIGKKYYDIFDFSKIKNKYAFPFSELERKQIMFITNFCYSRLKKERLLSFYFCREQKNTSCIEEYCENLSCRSERNYPE